jgi:hypothetical protein
VEDLEKTNDVADIITLHWPFEETLIEGNSNSRVPHRRQAGQLTPDGGA